MPLFKITLIGVFFSLIAGTLCDLKSQFLSVSIEVQPEISVAVVNPMNFGTLLANSGRININLGDPNMGFFEISALSSQELFIELQSPGFLEAVDPQNDARIPIYIESYLNNTPKEDYKVAELMPGNKKSLSVGSRNSIAKKSDPTWEKFYIYVVGYIEIGDTQAGAYTAQINVIIEYQ